VDDATSRLTQLHFCDSESTFSYFEATRRYLDSHGKPVPSTATSTPCSASISLSLVAATELHNSGGRSTSSTSTSFACSGPTTNQRQAGKEGLRQIRQATNPTRKTAPGVTRARQDATAMYSTRMDATPARNVTGAETADKRTLDEVFANDYWNRLPANGSARAQCGFNPSQQSDGLSQLAPLRQ